MSNSKDIVILSIDELLSKIYEYQRTNNIKEQCITNTQFVYNYIKTHFPNKPLKTVAVLVVADISTNERVICCNHIIIELNDELIEPSYEYSVFTNKKYYYTYQDFFITEYGKGYKCEYSKNKYLNKYTKMLSISTQINITNKYNKYINYSYYTELDNLLK